MTIRLPVPHFLLVPHRDQAPISQNLTSTHSAYSRHGRQHGSTDEHSQVIWLRLTVISVTLSIRNRYRPRRLLAAPPAHQPRRSVVGHRRNMWRRIGHCNHCNPNGQYSPHIGRQCNPICQYSNRRSQSFWWADTVFPSIAYSVRILRHPLTACTVMSAVSQYRACHKLISSFRQRRGLGRLIATTVYLTTSHVRYRHRTGSFSLFLIDRTLAFLQRDEECCNKSWP